MTCGVTRLAGARWRPFTLVALALAASIPAADPVLAKRPNGGADAKKAAPHPGPVLAVVSLSKQRIHIYGSTGLLAQSAVSTGMAGIPSANSSTQAAVFGPTPPSEVRYRRASSTGRSARKSRLSSPRSAWIAASTP